jgi:hypothetical protein
MQTGFVAYFNKLKQSYYTHVNVYKTITAAFPQMYIRRDQAFTEGTCRQGMWSYCGNGISLTNYTYKKSCTKHLSC